MRMKELIPQQLVYQIRADRKRYNAPGIGIAIATGPSPVTRRTKWEEQIIVDGIGKGDGTPFADDTIFPMASVSKPYAYLSVGMLIDRKTIVPSTGEPLTWHTKLRDILGDQWKLQDPVGTAEATLQDAAGMRCGIPPHIHSLAVETAWDMVYRLRYLRQGRGFRERFEYQGESPAAMTLVVETLTGQTYPDFIMDNLFKPLGLHSTANGTRELRKTGRLCDGFFRQGANPEVEGPEGWGTPRNIGWCMGEHDGEYQQGQSGLVTCLQDAAKLLREFLEPTVLPQSWTAHRHRPISILAPGEFPPEYFRWSPGVKSAGYAYGHYQMTYRGFEVLFTPGLEFGQRNYMCYLPDAKIGLWLATNEDGPGARLIEESVPNILDSLLGLDPFPPIPPATIITDPATLPRFYLPVGTAGTNPPLDAAGSERVLLNPKGFFDPGHYNLTFEPFDIHRVSPLSEVIKDAAQGSPARSKLQHVIKPSPKLKYYTATIDFKFISKLLVISTDKPGVYDWITVKYKPLLDGKPVELGSRPLAPPGKLILTERGLGLFGGWMDRSGLTARPVPDGWQEDWRKVQIGAEAWFDRV